MYRFEDNRRGWSHFAQQPLFWLLPLVIGIGIGALLLGPLHGLLAWSDGHRHGDYGRGAGLESRRQAAPARSHHGTVQPAPQVDSGVGHEFRGARGHERGFSGLSWPFFSPRLLVPLLLIAAGAWLLGRRPRGARSWNSAGTSRQERVQSEPGSQPTDAPPSRTSTDE